MYRTLIIFLKLASAGNNAVKVDRNFKSARALTLVRNECERKLIFYSKNKGLDRTKRTDGIQ
jgi:hypothetical protein